MPAGVTALDAFLQPCQSGPPGTSTAALLRQSPGPGPLWDHVFEGFDWLFLLNLSDAPLSDPLLGVDPTETDGDWLNPLLSGGWTRDMANGGSGDALLPELDPHGVHAMLITSTGMLFT